MSNKYNVSVILITKNEAKNIKLCLNSILWADEIIIVDSGSTDGTLEIIQEISQDTNIIKVYQHTDWQGFGIQKNVALSYASNDYVLSIDADEVLSPELIKSIQNICLNSTNNNLDIINNSMYKLLRLNYFCGKAVKYSGWQNDYVVRLFNKKYACFSNDKVHEKVILRSNNVKVNDNKLDGLLHHYSYTSYSQVLNKIEQYSSLGAEQLYAKNKKSSFFNAVTHGISAFIKSFIFKFGFLDASVGFNIAIMNALASYYKYIKLRQMHLNKSQLN
ncbi:MAG: hypothetical protein RLZZ210_330 [Pseudomonadota bacterium]|jgi:glycosyltransferase involved in cell wall biosynthesis